MELDVDESNDNTPLSEEERAGLRIQAIINHHQLNEHEQSNIEDAIQWLINKSFSADKILSEKFIKELHKRMFGSVWKWAGHFRTSEKNIGVERHKIPVHLRQLLGDVLFWIKDQTFTPDEIAIRFKHQLVSIHCFPNGNGRHSRLIADIIIEKLFAQPVFTWGAMDLTYPGGARITYIQALKAADNGNYSLLLAFARS
ncbi:MAG: mobile mystery protein B [Saprospiraceae bacterium]